MEVFEYSGQGLRDSNQDYVKCCSLDKEGAAVYVVTDGMGGYQYGEVAAKIVAESILDFITENIMRLSPAQLLKEAYRFANVSLGIKRMALGAEDMGCVAVVLLILGDTGYMAWRGDSRIYFFRNGRQTYRTVDHSMVEELSKIRALTAHDLDKYSSVVTKAIMGLDEDVSPELIKVGIEKGDIFLLCSDGLHRQSDLLELATIPVAEIKDYLDNCNKQMTDNYSLIRVTI